MTVTYMRRDYTLQESSFEVTHLVDCGRKLVEFLVSEHVEVLDGWMFDNGEEFGNNTGEEQGREGSEEEGGDDDGSSIDLRNHLRDDILQTVRVQGLTVGVPVVPVVRDRENRLMIERAGYRSLTLIVVLHMRPLSR